MLGFIWQVILSLGVSGALTLALVWLSKSVISERLKGAIKSEYDLRLESYRDTLRAESDAKLETLRSQLKASADTELERLRSSLAMAAAEHQIHVAGLYDRRADALQEIYALLSDLHQKLSSYVHVVELTGGPTKDERRASAAEAYARFSANFRPLLILVPESTAKGLRSIDARCVTAFNRFAFTVEGRDSANAYDTWYEIHKEVSEDIAQALLELENEFRSLLTSPSSPH